MRCKGTTWLMAGLLVLTASAKAADEPASVSFGRWLDELADRDTLTGNWFGYGDELAERGISIALGLTQAYQINLGDGASTHKREGRWTGSYDLEAHLDLDKLIGVPGGTVYVLAEGSWSAGLDSDRPGDVSVASLFNVNGDAAGNRAIDVTQLWYQQNLLEDRLRFRVGKLDMTGGFDCQGSPVGFDGNRFANDETSQFLNGALINNPTIPFPDYALGAIAYAEPVDGLFLVLGSADAQGDFRETGFRTAFHGPDYFVTMLETGWAGQLPLPWQDRGGAGTYRAGLWYDPQPKEDLKTGRMVRDDVGFYLSFDQTVFAEADADDQGLGVFFRYGYAHGHVNTFRHFWSVGAQYTGLIPGRDADVAGVGFAKGEVSEKPLANGGSPFSADAETVVEIYYRVQVLGWLSVSPSLQFVSNPGGTDGEDATVIGIRMQISF